MEKLNSDEKMQILVRLNGNEIIRVCQTSKDLYRVCNDERYDSLWQKKIKEEFNIEYNEKRGYDKYRDIRTIFDQKYYIVNIINTSDYTSTFTSLFFTRKDAENYIFHALSKFYTYDQIKFSLENLRYIVSPASQLFKIEERGLYKRPNINFENDEKRYKEEQENFQAKLGYKTVRMMRYKIEDINRQIFSENLGYDDINDIVNEEVDRMMNEFNLSKYEEELKSYFNKYIAIEK